MYTFRLESSGSQALIPVTDHLESERVLEAARAQIAPGEKGKDHVLAGYSPGSNGFPTVRLSHDRVFVGYDLAGRAILGRSRGVQGIDQGQSARGLAQGGKVADRLEVGFPAKERQPLYRVSAGAGSCDDGSGLDGCSEDKGAKQGEERGESGYSARGRPGTEGRTGRVVHGGIPARLARPWVHLRITARKSSRTNPASKPDVIPKSGLARMLYPGFPFHIWKLSLPC